MVLTLGTGIVSDLICILDKCMILCYIIIAITYSLNPMSPSFQFPFAYFFIWNVGLTIVPTDPAYDPSTPDLNFDSSDMWGINISSFFVV